MAADMPLLICVARWEYKKRPHKVVGREIQQTDTNPHEATNHGNATEISGDRSAEILECCGESKPGIVVIDCTPEPCSDVYHFACLF
jgi:hypothetical protein